jgi:hypothetical protein
MPNARAAAANGLITVVDTQGTVVEEDEWVNEIHPGSNGFAKVAQKIFREGRP